MLRSDRHIAALIALICSVACACGSDSDGDATPADVDLDVQSESHIALLSPTAHLARASLALRGIRPNLDELQAVEADPDALESLVEAYLESPEFGRTMRELHAESLLVEVDAAIYPAGFPAIGALADQDVQAINRSVIEAPLRLIEHIVTEDRPYTEIVTADHAYADPVVATIWGMDREDDDGEGWSRAQYQDGRPHAGILSDSFLFTRHSTTFSNKSRGRANAISRALLCYDFLDRDVEIDATIDLADPELVSDAIRQQPACVSCHQSLDPLGAYFSTYFPVFLPADIDAYPYSTFAPALARPFRATDPGYFGASADDLLDLGRRIADDPRFSLCAARRFFGYLAGVELDDVPLALISELQEVLERSGFDAKALAKGVVLSDAFRVSHLRVSDEADVDDGQADEVVGLKRLRPQQLARSVQDLTGFRWRIEVDFDFGSGRIGEVDLMEDSLFGFVVLAGGVDGMNVTRPSHTMSATSTLAVRGLAAQAAPHVVEADLALSDPAQRRLLTELGEDPSDPDAARRQLAALHGLVYGELVAPDAAPVQETHNLFEAVLGDSGGNAERAWTMVLYTMLQDARFLFY